MLAGHTPKVVRSMYGAHQMQHPAGFPAMTILAIKQRIALRLQCPIPGLLQRLAHGRKRRSTTVKAPSSGKWMSPWQLTSHPLMSIDTSYSPRADPTESRFETISLRTFPSHDG